MSRSIARHTRPIGLATLVVGSVGATAFACSNATSPDRSGTFFGPAATMANGSGRAYVVLDRGGVPTALGVALTEAALTGLPAASSEYVFALPAQASTTAYKHAVVNWVALGHPPAGVYTVPHFDFHFYSITEQEREAITAADPQYAAKIARLPSADLLPTGYAQGMAAERMGLHWLDPAAPERQGIPFTKTFIAGSYDGAVTFAEPMITKAYLDAKPEVVVTPIKPAARYAATGYQPTSYTVGFDASTTEYRVALTGLVLR